MKSALHLSDCLQLIRISVLATRHIDPNILVQSNTCYATTLTLVPGYCSSAGTAPFSSFLSTPPRREPTIYKHAGWLAQPMFALCFRPVLPPVLDLYYSEPVRDL